MPLWVFKILVVLVSKIIMTALHCHGLTADVMGLALAVWWLVNLLSLRFENRDRR